MVKGVPLTADGAAEDGWIGGEVLLPVAIADDGDGVAAGSVRIGGLDGAPEERLSAEHAKEVSGDEVADGLCGGGCGGDV